MSIKIIYIIQRNVKTVVACMSAHCRGTPKDTERSAAIKQTVTGQHLSPLQAQLDITLETEADLSELDSALAQQEHSFTGFARQMWAYITVRQLIAER